MFESLPGSATDGSRLFFLQIQDGRTALSQALIVDGESSLLSLPSEIASPSLGDISPDGSRLLVRNHLAPDAEQALWIVPALGGGARRMNALAHDGTWMPDGKRILIASGNDLIIAKEDGTETRKLATLPGRAFWLRWSPDGATLRFTLIDPKDHTTSLWEASADGSHVHQLLHGANSPQMECCGNWTADGKYFVFQMTHNGMTNIWGITEKSSFFGPKPYVPWQITNGPLSYQAPITARSGHEIFFLGMDARYDLLRYDSSEKQFVPFGKSLHGVGRTAFSRDGQRVAWVRPGDGSLWCSRSDGSERLQLTASPMQVFVFHWAPDDRQVAFMGREPGKPWKIYLVPATGGSPEMLLQEDRNEADPDWSPDGRYIVFGRPPEVMAEGTVPKAIHILDLQTKQVSTLPGSAGMFSPRWSPDGRYIAATPLSEENVKIYDMTKGTWTTLVSHIVSDLEWSHDGKWIYFHDYMEDGAPLYRVSIEKKLERVADLSSLHAVDAVDYSFSGLAPGDVPMLRARMWTANLFSLDLDRH
jgi:Tol biopolymer transport system component